MTGTGPTEVALLVLCIILSAFFSSAEAAFLSVQRTTRLAHLVKGGIPAARKVAEMLEQPGRLLSTILLGNNLVNVAFTAVITAVVLNEIDDQRTGLVIATATGTTTLLLLGEIIPKTIAVRFPMGTAMRFTRPLRIVELALLPLVIVLQWASRIADIGKNADETDSSITEAELRTLIDIGEAEGEFDPNEADRLERVFRFGDKNVREVMTPRTEIVFVERGATLLDFLNIYADHSHTRFPVFKETSDNIIGIVSSKDILKAMASKAIKWDDPVTDFLRDVSFVPETKRIAELFEEIRRVGNQMTIAIDEFGGIAGLVTTKSLLEEVVGRVGEEGLSPEEKYEAIGTDTFRIDGGMSIDEATEELGIEFPEGEYDTVAGFVLEILGHIPAQGEKLKYRNIKIEITRMDGLRVVDIKLTKTESAAEME